MCFVVLSLFLCKILFFIGTQAAYPFGASCLSFLGLLWVSFVVFVFVCVLAVLFWIFCLFLVFWD